MISPIKNSRGASLTRSQIAALASLYPGKGNQFCKEPIGIECYDENGDEAKTGVTCNVRKGFSCRGKECKDYKIKICCPESENVCKRFPRACSPTQKCEPLYYAHECECARGYSMTEEGDCVDLESQCKCGCSGDPHCYACNRFFFDFMGPCRYLAITNNCPHTGKQYPSVEVITKHKPCGKPAKKVTCTESMQVRLCQTRARARAGDCIIADLSSRRGGCRVTRRASNKWLNNKVSARMCGRKCVFKGFGLKLDIQGSKWNSVIDSKFKEKMCGLCGKWTNADDYIINRKGDPFKFELKSKQRRINGKKRRVDVINKRDSATYGDQWLYNDPDSTDEKCSDPTLLGEECTKEETAAGLEACKYFKVVADLLKDDDYSEFMNGCAEDVCSDVENAVCEALNSYVDKKVVELGIDVVPNWKNSPESPCPMNCSEENQRPSLGFLKQPYCDGTEYKGVLDCVCEMGYVLDPLSDKCVKQEDCSCTTESGKQLQPRQTVYNTKDCTEKQRCTAGRIETETSDASPQANCTEDELTGCRDGYDGDGKVCTPSTDSCIAGWTKSSQGCVKVFDDPLNFPLAAQRCREESGELVAAAKSDDEETILALIKDNPGVQYFIAGLCKGSSADDVQDGRTKGAESYVRPTVGGVPACSAGDTPECFAASTTDGKSLKIEKITCLEKKKFVCVKKPEEDFKLTDWCSGDEPEAGDQEEENPTTMRAKDCKTCENPRAIECRSIANQKPSTEFSDTKCNLEDFFVGDQCEEGETCDDFEVRMLCPKRINECKKDLDLCNNEEDCINTEFGYTCQCSGEGQAEVFRDGKDRCADVKTCTMSRQNAGGVDFVAFDSADPDTPLTLSRTCAFYLLNTKDCDSKLDRPGRSDVAIMVSKASRASGMVIQVGSNSIALSAGGALRHNGDPVIDVNVITTNYSLELTADKEYRFMTADKEIVCDFEVTTTGLQRIQCRATDFYNPSCGMCTIGDNDVSTDANVQQFFEKNSVSGSSCLPPPGQETETTIATFGTPVVVTTTPGTVTSTMASPTIPPTTSEPIDNCADPKCDDLLEAMTNCDRGKNIHTSCKAATCSGIDICSFVTTKIAELESAYNENSREDICRTIGDVRNAVEALRTLSKCDGPTCKSANWKLRYGAPPFAKTCAFPYRSDETVDAAPFNFDAKCVCIPGMVLNPVPGASGMECVPLTECGCRYKQQYIPIGGYYEDKETCTGTFTCKAFDTIVPSNKTCVDNAICKDGKCVCDEGFMGDGYELCEKVIDYPEKRCIQSYDASSSITRLRCECKMGYASTCETCIDIDECATSNDCDPTTKCVNLPGTYECQCRPGFTRVSNTTCKDIKECESNPCPDNSVCYEGQGSYYCKCCEGFQKKGSVCEPIDKVNPPNKCCTCTVPECFAAPDGKPDAGCYVDIDGETAFDSFHTAFIYRCIKNQPFVKGNFRYEPCTTPVETVTTTTPGALPTATTTAATTQPPPPDPCRDTAVCDLTQENDKTTGPVCSENNVKFPNLCAFKQAECRGNGNTPPPTLKTYTRGECPTTTPPPTSPDPTSPYVWEQWGSYGPCDAVDCQTPGKQTRERSYLLRNDAPLSVPPENERVSFISCKKSGCTVKPTDPPTTVIPDQCEYLQCSNENSPVCGAIAAGSPTTYDSECRLKKRACDSTPRAIYRVISRTPCPDENGEPPAPSMCNEGPIVKKVSYNITRGAVSCFYEAEMNVCESLACVNPGGNTGSNICCKGTVFAAEKVTVTALCTDNSNEVIHMENPEKCECQDEEAG